MNEQELKACGEAFEEWRAWKVMSGMDEDFAWGAFQAAWNRRTEPEWKDISTAPKVGRPMIVVIGVFPSGYVTDPWCVWWQDGEWQRWPHENPPTHWKPLPAAPNSK